MDTVTEFAKNLRRPGVVTGFQIVTEARKYRIPRSRDVVPGVSCTGAEAEISPLRATIEADMIVVA